MRRNANNAFTSHCTASARLLRDVSGVEDGDPNAFVVITTPARRLSGLLREVTSIEPRNRWRVREQRPVHRWLLGRHVDHLNSPCVRERVERNRLREAEAVHLRLVDQMHFAPVLPVRDHERPQARALFFRARRWPRHRPAHLHRELLHRRRWFLGQAGTEAALVCSLCRLRLHGALAR